MIVADTNLIAYLLIPGDHTQAAERVLARDPDWAAPLLWRSEFRNVLTLHIRRRSLSLAESLEIAADAELLMQDKEYEVSSAQVLSLAASSRCSAYDCEFVALAQNLGVPLLTADRDVLTDFPSLAVSVDAFTP
jgi:predicted nucleic acid-binding protein